MSESFHGGVVGDIGTFCCTPSDNRSVDAYARNVSSLLFKRKRTHWLGKGWKGEMNLKWTNVEDGSRECSSERVSKDFLFAQKHV